MKNENGTLAVFGCIGMILSIPLAAALSGYTLSVLWGWFVVATFHLPALSIPQAMGISVIVHKLTHQDIEIKKHEQAYMPFVMMFLPSAMSLLMGWIVRMFL